MNARRTTRSRAVALVLAAVLGVSVSAAVAVGTAGRPDPGDRGMQAYGERYQAMAETDRQVRARAAWAARLTALAQEPMWDAWSARLDAQAQEMAADAWTARLNGQAQKMAADAWTARLNGLAEAYPTGR